MTIVLEPRSPVLVRCAGIAASHRESRATVVKLRVPPNCRSVSYRGELVTIDCDGTIEVDEIAAAIFAAHGFALQPSPLDEQESEYAGIDAVASLNRSGLFSLLRSLGVGVTLPITNAELRAVARNTLEKKMAVLPPSRADVIAKPSGAL